MARQRPDLAPRGRRRREQARMDAEAHKRIGAIGPLAVVLSKHFEDRQTAARKITDAMLRIKR